MVFKAPILPNRIRKVPKQFSWIDHRLVRDRHIENCSHPAAMLYLFLLTVGDARGLSYYADKSIMKRLSMNQSTLDSARINLIQTGLIAWQKPLYQVLSLDSQKVEQKTQRSSMAKALSLGEILNMAREGAS